jgi:transposase
MIEFHDSRPVLVGKAGQLPVAEDDEITRKLAMLFEGECEGDDVVAVARKFGYSRQRYYQLRQRFAVGGALALHRLKTGPKRNYRRTQEAVRQIIRHLFLDRAATPEIVAQKLRQLGLSISVRSVQRVVREYGLQKKTPRG